MTMAGTLNSVTLIGHLGADPEIRSFQNGGKVCNMRIATSQKWRDKQTGEQRERTEWHSIVLTGDGLVGVAEKYLVKGSLISVQGRLRTRKWQDQSGNDRYSTEIVVSQFSGSVGILRGGNDGGSGGQSDRQGGGAQGGGFDDLDDEVPF